jgi:hypothetical protein
LTYEVNEDLPYLGLLLPVHLASTGTLPLPRFLLALVFHIFDLIKSTKIVVRAQHHTRILAILTKPLAHFRSLFPAPFHDIVRGRRDVAAGNPMALFVTNNGITRPLYLFVCEGIVLARQALAEMGVESSSILGVEDVGASAQYAVALDAYVEEFLTHFGK